MIGIVATDLLPLTGELLVGVALAGAGAAAGWRTFALRMVGLCVLVAALGGLRYLSAQVATTPQSVWLLAGEGPVLVQGHVAQEPRLSDTGQQVLLQTEAARLDERSGAVEGLLLVNVPPWPAYHYGQRLIVRGQIEQPPTAERPNAFDYREYLARKGIFALVQEPEVQTLPGNVGNPLLVSLLRFRSYCHALLLRALPEPQAAVAAGMLLGLKASIPDQTYNTFAQTGTVHMLVVSGWHLSLVAALFMGIAAQFRLGRGATFWVALAGIWLYALFVGATPTVLRAAIMASLIVLASSTERQTEPWTLLLAACLGLSLWNPHILWDLGFQLSVLATASLFAFSQPVKSWLEHWPLLRWSEARFITDTLSATLAVQVLVLPLIVYHFGNLSLIAPLANVLIVPMVPFAMMLGALALVVNLLAAVLAAVPLLAPLADWLAYGLWLLAWLPFAAMTEAARLLSDLPWAAVRLPTFPLWVLLTYYALLVSAWAWRRWAAMQDRSTPSHSSTAMAAIPNRDTSH
jgi:competence protein ComEC